MKLSDMKVDIWMDLTCPFCYLGKKKFITALQQFEGKDQVTLRLRSFELDAQASKDYPGTVYDWLAKRYGRTREEVVEMNIPVLQQAESLGLTFNLDQAKPTNSFDAHRLIHYAATERKELMLSDELFKAYFTDGKNIADTNVLVEAGKFCGLDESKINGVLFSDKFAEEVREDEALAQRLSIRGVPFFLFNGTHAISGSQPTHMFSNALQQLSKQ